MVAYQPRNRAVFLYGFAKSERDNIDDDELEALREIAAEWLKADAAALARQISEGLAEEVTK